MGVGQAISHVREQTEALFDQRACERHDGPRSVIIGYVTLRPSASDSLYSATARHRTYVFTNTVRYFDCWRTKPRPRPENCHI
ncbi:hypothetical protein LshimejAT787_0403790 [Lyophyllum shimeji]|uniref:Uncharacterized protein n=1 Tax=Lyophyllum shimeji TaxID=47721 RepID=A0A9P3UL64_LYOSH|nr:hypothetical protein LshimejAT787_0403790 [Lyophyllum shimeji]